LRDQETALVKLGELYRDQKCVVVSYIVWELTDGGKRNAKGLAEVITLSRAFMSSTAKAKTAKLSTSHFFPRAIFPSSIFFLIGFTVRTLLDHFIPIPDSKQIQINVLVDNIDWAKREKRIFLKHSLETRLVGL
jgi:26S proteasome regulatory subunit N6